MYTPWQWESTFVCQCSAWMGHVLKTWENNSRTYLMLHTVLGLSLKVFPQSGIEQGELLFLEIWKHIFFYLNYSYLLQHSKNLILFYRLQKITFLKIFHIFLFLKKKICISWSLAHNSGTTTFISLEPHSHPSSLKRH